MSAPATPAASWWRSGRAKAAAALVGVLLVGVVLGAALDRRAVLRHLRGDAAATFMGRRHGGPGGPGGPGHGPFDVRRMRNRLVRDLGLNDTQAARVDTIMSRRTAAFRAAHAEAQARVRAMIDTTDAMIDSVLTPEQRARFREIRARRAARRGTPGESDSSWRPQ